MHRIPFGYTPSRQKGAHYPEPNDDAEIVHQIFIDRTNGLSLSQLAAKHQSLKKNRMFFSRLLKNRFYIGDVHINGEWQEGMHKSIISKELFELAQRSFDSK